MTSTILFFYGPDTYRSRQKLLELTQRYIDKSLGDTNLSMLDGAKVSFDELVRQIQALPFLAAKRLVVVQNLLTQGKKEVHEQVTGYLSKVPSTTVVVFYEAGEPDKRTKLFKALNQPKARQYFPVMSPDELARWLDDAAEAAGVRLAPAARQLLLGGGGQDLWRLAQDMEKLTLYAQTSAEREITEVAVRELVSLEMDSDVFRLIEAIAAGQRTRALHELHRLLEHGEAEFYLLSMIVYQYRILLGVTELAEQGVRLPAQVAKQLAIPPFVAQKTLRLVGKRTTQSFVRDYLTICEYDVAMKTGRLEPMTALELLILALTK